MGKVIIENVRILEDYFSKYIMYKTDKYRYEIRADRSYVNGFSPIVYIYYYESKYSKKYSSRNGDKIPKKHSEILLELYEIYKDVLILPIVLTNDINKMRNL